MVDSETCECEVKVDPLQQRIQAAEADETRQEGERRIGFAASLARTICVFWGQVHGLFGCLAPAYIIHSIDMVPGDLQQFKTLDFKSFPDAA